MKNVLHSLFDRLNQRVVQPVMEKVDLKRLSVQVYLKNVGYIVAMFNMNKYILVNLASMPLKFAKDRLKAKH